MKTFVTKLRNEQKVIAEEELILEGFSLVPEDKVVQLMFYNDDLNLL
jgi:hypothetical protein